MIELLVVISIIALLVALLLPSLAAARQTAQMIQCESNQKGLGILFAQYSNANKAWWVPWQYNPTSFTNAPNTTPYTSAQPTLYSRLTAVGYLPVGAQYGKGYGYANGSVPGGVWGIGWYIYLDGLYVPNGGVPIGAIQKIFEAYQRQFFCPSTKNWSWSASTASGSSISYGYNAYGLGTNEYEQTGVATGPGWPNNSHDDFRMKRTEQITSPSHQIVTADTRGDPIGNAGFINPSSGFPLLSYAYLYHPNVRPTGAYVMEAGAAYYRHLTADTENTPGTCNTLFGDSHVSGCSINSKPGPGDPRVGGPGMKSSSWLYYYTP